MIDDKDFDAQVDSIVAQCVDVMAKVFEENSQNEEVLLSSIISLALEHIEVAIHCIDDFKGRSILKKYLEENISQIFTETQKNLKQIN